MDTLCATNEQAHADAAKILLARSARPPVIILNMFHSGLGIARDFAGKGIRVIGLSSDPEIYGNFTRHCEVRMAPNSQDAPEGLFERLLQLSSELRGAVIFPTRDADVLLLDRFRDNLANHFTLAIPPRDCLLRVMDKYALATAAQHAGLPIPRTIRISAGIDLCRVEREVGFPCVLKPVFAVTWRGADSWKNVGARKAVRVESVQQLESEYKLLSQVDNEMLVQQWVPGAADQIVVLGGYVQNGGDLTQYFTARKLIQSPDDFGTGCVIESQPIPKIVTLSERLCRALRYEGMAEIEYKYDQKSQQFLLIEINTRHWDWHRLASASDINLSWTAYRDLTGHPLERGWKRTARAKWVAEDALFIYALRALSRRQIRLRDLWRTLAGPRIYGVLDWRDPRPALRYCFLRFLPDLAKALFLNLRRGRLS
jgi:D-aspartate ligase